MEDRREDGIAIYVPSLRGGGAERVMVTLANAFAVRGYAVDLLLVKAEGPYLNEVADAVRVMDLGSSRVLTSLPGLVRYLRRERPLALLSAMRHANVIAVVARDLARVSTRMVVSERNHFSVSSSGVTGVGAHLMRLFMRWTYRRAEGIVAVSGGVADDLSNQLNLPRNDIEVVFNPVLNERLHALAAEPANHAWLPTDDIPLVLAVGRLTQQKGFDTLIRAFARLRASRLARLVILGEGELRETLDAAIKQQGLRGDVSLPGFLDNPFPVMRRANLFVLSSRWEGLPNVLIQAMACGTPVVATDCPSGPAEILENGKWGRLVPMEDEAALAEAMAATLDETQHPDVAARAAEFSVDRAVDGYLRVLQEGGADLHERQHV